MRPVVLRHGGSGSNLAGRCNDDPVRATGDSLSLRSRTSPPRRSRGPTGWLQPPAAAPGGDPWQVALPCYNRPASRSG